MKIIFFGNWNLGYLALKKILERDIFVSYVVTNYDREDKDIYRNKVYDLACSFAIPVYKRYKDILPLISEDEAVGFSVAYGNEIFQQDILNKMKIYNFHASYLPYYKGRAPIQWQIKNKEEEWGMSCHEVDFGIDTGRIVNRSKFPVEMDMPYTEALDGYNESFSCFILDNAEEIITKMDAGGMDASISNEDSGEKYMPCLTVPKNLWNSKIKDVSDYFNRKRAVFFVGNRAELGILFPLVLEMSGLYYVDVLVYGSYFFNGGQDLEEKREYIKRNHYNVNFIILQAESRGDAYFNSLPDVYRKVFQYLRKQESYPYKYAIVLGDRIESLGFALAAFYGQVPLVHVAGGDIADVPYFDTNIRHCISKMACIHLPFHEECVKTLRQLGEEDSRICNMGNPSFDYGRLGLIASKEQLEREFHIGEGVCVVFIYHSGPYKSEEENLLEYKECLEGVLKSKAYRVIITYPNFDHGSAGIIRYLDAMTGNRRITVVKTLGTPKLHALMEGFKTVIAGNSSAGLLETPFYMCPVLNMGDRQKGRPRCGNVADVEIDAGEIAKRINGIIDHYEVIKKEFEKYKTSFGDGEAAKKAVKFLREYDEVPGKELNTKRFVRRI